VIRNTRLQHVDMQHWTPWDGREEKASHRERKVAVNYVRSTVRSGAPAVGHARCAAATRMESNIHRFPANTGREVQIAIGLIPRMVAWFVGSRNDSAR
jgi:hypothetical protein